MQRSYLFKPGLNKVKPKTASEWIDINRNKVNYIKLCKQHLAWIVILLLCKQRKWFNYQSVFKRSRWNSRKMLFVMYNSMARAQMGVLQVNADFYCESYTQEQAKSQSSRVRGCKRFSVYSNDVQEQVQVLAKDCFQAPWSISRVKFHVNSEGFAQCYSDLRHNYGFRLLCAQDRVCPSLDYNKICH